LNFQLGLELQDLLHMDEATSRRALAIMDATETLAMETPALAISMEMLDITVETLDTTVETGSIMDTMAADPKLFIQSTQESTTTTDMLDRYLQSYHFLHSIIL
jgi:hypothetical protein